MKTIPASVQKKTGNQYGAYQIHHKDKKGSKEKQMKPMRPLIPASQLSCSTFAIAVKYSITFDHQIPAGATDFFHL